MPLKIHVIFAHPYPIKSQVCSAIIKALSELKKTHTRDLYSLYPDFQIDVPAEQSALIDADIITLVHPIYWYSCPALLKEWIDRVLEEGFAFGTSGDKLKNKYWLPIVSAGNQQSSYQNGGSNNFTIEEFFRPFEQTARLCQMRYLSPLVFFQAGSHRESDLQTFIQLVKTTLQNLQTKENN